MRIENLRTECGGARVRHAATVIWEDSERPAQDVYFETGEEFAEGFCLNPDAFLNACVLPAMHHNEARVSVDGEVCPGLVAGLEHVLNTMRLWFYEPQERPLRIETSPRGRARLEDSATARRAGSMFSSGVDSMAMLRHNHLTYPPDHPWFIHNAFTIMGQNIESDMSEPTLRQAVIDYSAVTADTGATLIPVYTNIRALENDGKFFRNVNHGAIMASVAHSFARGIHTAFIASSDNLGEIGFYKQPTFSPWGSHPMIDNYCSSASVQIRHESLVFTRLDRLRIIAGWDAGLQKIRVCGGNWPGPNCGKCERCVRTMLGLLVLGVLDKTRAFPADNLTGDDLQVIRMRPHNPHLNNATRAIYYEFIPYLESAGRDDLVRAIRNAEKPRKKRPHARMKAAVKRLMGRGNAQGSGAKIQMIKK